MLHEFLTANRADLIDRCRSKVILRSSPKATAAELMQGIPIFLRQLIETLEAEQISEPVLNRKISGPADGGKPNVSEVAVAAAQHGRELLRHGFTIDQVVHDYGDLCQAITDLAFDRNEPIETDEFRTLNRCLDNAIADAVKEFSYQRDALVADKADQSYVVQQGIFAHELGNHLHTATLALEAIKAGKVGLAGATGAILDRSLAALRTLVDRSLSETRLTAGVPVQSHLFSLADFIGDVRLSASLEAHVNKCVFTVCAVDPQLAVDADRDLLSSALGNLLQNAFKFTHNKTEVTLNAYATADRILIDVEDHCGGLPAGNAERMFLQFTQYDADKTGVGLGLSIARRSVEANKGMLRVRNKPGSGCIFTIDLPRHSLVELSFVSSAPA